MVHHRYLETPQGDEIGWEMLPSMPGPRYDHECAALGHGGIVVVGGQSEGITKVRMVEERQEGALEVRLK